VLHVWEPGLASSLDEALQLLALEFPGTRFARAPARACSHLLRRLRRPAGAWLVAARGGKVVGIVAADGEAAEPSGESRRGEVGAQGGGVGDESSDFSEASSWVRRKTSRLQRRHCSTLCHSAICALVSVHAAHSAPGAPPAGLFLATRAVTNQKKSSRTSP
jgi:hypothetical protein